MIIPVILQVMNKGRSGKICIDKTRLILICVALHTVITTVVHSVPLINIVISIIYLLPFLLFVLMIGAKNATLFLDDCQDSLFRLIRIEVIATAVNLIKRILGKNPGDDWSTGTFGNAQQAQLFIIFALATILLFRLYIFQKKSMKALGQVIVCFLCALSTNCWTQLAVTIILILLTYISTLDKKIIIRIVLCIASAIVFVSIFINYYSDSKYGQQILRIMSDQSYRNYRVAKINTYKETFYEIPKRDLTFLLIGNGLGWYSSRGALTCTGAYIEGYNELFRVSMSDYTKEYIYPGLLRAYKQAHTDLGSVLARPYSTFVSVMGEIGIIGLSLLFILFSRIIRQFGMNARVLLMTWLASCFVENFLEYSKVILFLYICIYLGALNTIKRGKGPIILNKKTAMQQKINHKLIHPFLTKMK